MSDLVKNTQLSQEWLGKEYLAEPEVALERILLNKVNHETHWARSGLGKNYRLSQDWLGKEYLAEPEVALERILLNNVNHERPWFGRILVELGVAWERILNEVNQEWLQAERILN